MNLSRRKLIGLIFLIGALLVFTTFYPKPEIVTRENWGALPLDKSRASLKLQNPQAIVIHHSGTVLKDSVSPIEYLRNLQLFSRNKKGWPDLPYHYLIDVEGIIYEGLPVKYCGSTNTDYDPCDKVHVTLIGNFNKEQPEKQQVESTKNLVSELHSRFSVSEEQLYLHKELAATDCPGTNLAGRYHAQRKKKS